MWNRKSYILDTLTEAYNAPKSRVILWNKNMEVSLCELNSMVSAENLLNCNYWKIPFTLHTGASDKQLGAVISQNDKPIALFSRKLSKPWCN